MADNYDPIRRLMSKVQDSAETRRLVRKIEKEATEEEIENFLFVAAGHGKIIKGMHYPDSAFIDGEYPLIYKTTDNNVVISAWPRLLLKEMMLGLEEKYPEEKWDEVWQDLLQGLVDKSVEKLKEAKDLMEGL